MGLFKSRTDLWPWSRVQSYQRLLRRQRRTWTPNYQVRRVQKIQSLAQTRAFGTILPDTADDPDLLAVENGVRAGDGLFDVAADPRNGHLHAAWRDSRFSGGQIDQIAYSQSTDSGATWSHRSRSA